MPQAAPKVKAKALVLGELAETGVRPRRV